MEKYSGNFENRNDVAAQFQTEDVPEDQDIIYAEYDTPDYEGYAFVLFMRDGKLYEVHGSHCSCYGLEGQWEPEETSWEAIAMREKYAHLVPKSK